MNKVKLTTAEMRRLTASEYRASDKSPLALVLDDVRSAHNVGSALRTADAFRLAEVALCGVTPCPPSAEIHKTAIGAEDVVDWQHYPTAAEAVAALRAQGFTLVALEQCHGSVPLNEVVNNLPAGAKVALVLGNEVRGVSQQVVDMCDMCAEIPQRGTKHSLNVSVAAGIAVWELSRQY